MHRRQLLTRLDKAWVALNESYAGLSDARLDTYGHYPLHAEAIRQWRQRISPATGHAFGGPAG